MSARKLRLRVAPFFLRDSRASDTRFARSTIPEEKWGLLVVYNKLCFKGRPMLLICSHGIDMLLTLKSICVVRVTNQGFALIVFRATRLWIPCFINPEILILI